jgi:hypothetical protein
VFDSNKGTPLVPPSLFARYASRVWGRADRNGRVHAILRPPVTAWQTFDGAIGARWSLTAVAMALTMRGHDHGPFSPKCHATAFPLCLECGLIG